jgi:DNA-binding NtrC family response regulator
LIQGESGTGKELVATAVQRLSARSRGPFEKINCADFTPELLRSELFGHERGAFSGASVKKVGLLSTADGGTVGRRQHERPLAAIGSSVRTVIAT